MGVFYIISIIILLCSFILVKKSKNKINIISFISISIVLLFCYNTFICYILTFCTIPIKLWLLTIINLIISAIFGVIIAKKREIQKYFFRKIDVVCVFVIAISVLIVSYIFFGWPINVNSESGDAPTHYTVATMFADSDHLLNANQNPDPIHGTGAGMRPTSYVNSGLIMKSLEPDLNLFECYKIFAFFSIFVLFLTGIIMYFSISNFSKNREHTIYALLASLICIFGYPLNSMLFGFEYMSMGLLILVAIINISYYYQKNILNFKYNLIIFFLLNFGLFCSYYMFVPFVYSALWIYFCIDNYIKTKKIITKKLVVLLSITLLLPFFLGYLYNMMPGVYSWFVRNIVNTENIINRSDSLLNSSFKLNGYIYVNIYSNMLLLIPFVIYIAFKDRKDNKLILLFSLFAITFIEILFIGYLFEKVSIYYISKNYYALWIFLTYSFGVSLILISQKSAYISRLLIGSYILLIVLSLVFSKVDVEYWTNLPKESISTVTQIFGANKTILLQKPIDINQEELEILKYMKENLNINSDIELIADEGTYYWGYALMRYKLCPGRYDETLGGQKLLATRQYIAQENIGKAQYMVYFTRSKKYEEVKEKLFNNCSIVYENSAGGIIKYNK